MKVGLLQVAAVALGGALGASLRYLIAIATHQLLGYGFPYGTLVVNAAGSALIGYLVVFLPDSAVGIPLLRLLLITGLLGGFTTFSTFSLETLVLAQNGHFLRAGLNVALTLVVCLGAVWLGYLLARGLHGAN
ncbi:fluoride efflux transporter CrcB [Elongatibacter sediminis]|uniref:Fluoride-specific ion channel FluC n=1 Tax=Elongatibacter sediminis TaxID=3119006 RepID=A0AAW9REQ8_9GAMM